MQDDSKTIVVGREIHGAMRRYAFDHEISIRTAVERAWNDFEAQPLAFSVKPRKGRKVQS